MTKAIFNGFQSFEIGFEYVRMFWVLKLPGFDTVVPHFPKEVLFVQARANGMWDAF